MTDDDETDGGPVCRLRWYPERGFELDLNAVVGDTSLMLVAVPIPADGTVELRSGKLELDKLEILFKAQVDVAGAPGQLTEAFVTLVGDADGGPEVLRLDASVENVEHETVESLQVDVPVEVPAGAPSAGGPRPDPVDEAELDWDDDDTHEAFFKDPLTQEDPLPVAARAPSGDDEEAGAEGSGGGSPAPTGAERGFDRLLKALLAEDSQLDDGDDTLDDEDDPEPAPPPAADQRVTSGGTVLSLISDALSAEPESPDGSDDPADARGLLAFLVEREALEIEDGHSVDELVAGAAPILATPRSPATRAAELSEWLFSQPAVAELYIGDDDLASLIEQW